MRLSLFVAIAALTGCRDVAGPSPRFEPQVAVYAVFQPDSAVVHVVADRLDDAGLRFPLSGASGLVEGPGGSVVLVEGADSLGGCFVMITGSRGPATEGCYAGRLPLAPVPGDLITLEFVLPEGDTITGLVMVPGAPVASIPPEFQTVSTNFQGESATYPAPIALVPIDLDSAPFAATVRAIASVAAAGGIANGSRNCASGSYMTPYVAPQLSGRHEFVLNDVICTLAGRSLGNWSYVDIVVDVWSVDANYSAYIREVAENSALDVTRTGFGVEGAAGVFGAVATTALSFRVTYDP